MKRLLCLLLCGGLLLAAGCERKEPLPSASGPVETGTGVPTASPTPSEDPNAFVFTRENMPRLNGSTATVPMAQAVCSVLLGESREEASDLVQFSKTTQSYRELLWDNADLLISAEPNQEVLDMKEERGFQWEMEPFATDAFVFLVNEGNPVDSLTLEEIQKIYTGEYTNWKQVGGEDLEIVPFQRNQGAGSQTLMEKLVMAGLTMMEPPADFVRGEMGGLMDGVRAFDGSASAIGYSVYYYAEEMEMAGGLKLLAVDGVHPTPETIRSGEYPLLNPYYVVISADEPEDSPARILFDWMLSPEGQRLADAEGYVSVSGEG